MLSTPLICCSIGDSNGLFHRHRIGSRIGCGDNNFGRCNIRKERDWQETQRNDPDDHRDQRNDDRKDRPVNEKSGHRYCVLSATGGVHGVGLTS